MLRPTKGRVNLAVGPMNHPARLLLSKTVSSKLNFDTLRPPFNPNLNWACACAENSKATANNNADKYFFMMCGKLCVENFDMQLRHPQAVTHQ